MHTMEKTDEVGDERVVVYHVPPGIGDQRRVLGVGRSGDEREDQAEYEETGARHPGSIGVVLHHRFV
jgi:hypothetical protein